MAYWGRTDDHQMSLIELKLDYQSKCAYLISLKGSDDRRAIRERDIIIGRCGPKSLRERNARVIHDTTFTTEISADVHLELIKEGSVHSGDVRGRGSIQVDRL